MPEPAQILVVDDEQPNRAFLKAILKREGYGVVEAENGLVALDILESQHIDVVLLDILMPRLDGFDTCERIRKERGDLELPVVFITALGDRDARVRGKALGADDFLTKPIDATELLARVKVLVELRTHRERLARQREAIQEELDTARQQLLRADRLVTLGSLAGAVGHELANVNVVQRMSVEELGDLASENSRLAELQSRFRWVDNHLETHSRQLLELGRPGPERATEIVFEDVVRTVIEMLAISGRTKHVEITTASSAAPTHVTFNSTRVEQVLMNLLINAADASLDVEDAQIHVSVDPVGTDRLRCAVRDNGTGITDETKQRILEPYFTTKEPGFGTGLGMPVVKQIIDSYGGSLEIDTVVGEGTTVSFELPRLAPTSQNERPRR